MGRPIIHTPGGHQVQCAMASVTWGLIDWMLGHGWTRSLLGLTSLNRGFLIGTDHPDPPLQQCLGFLDVLPGVEPPGADLLGGEPAPDGPRGNGGQGRNGGHMTSQFGATPMSQRNAMRAR